EGSKAPALERCEVAVDPQLARRVIDDWTQMLGRAAPKEDTDVGLDGVTTRFSKGDGAVEARTWSPDERSKPGLLVAMAYAMHDYCRSHKPEQLADLERLSSVLQDSLVGVAVVSVQASSPAPDPGADICRLGAAMIAAQPAGTVFDGE